MVNLTKKMIVLVIILIYQLKEVLFGKEMLFRIIFGLMAQHHIILKEIRFRIQLNHLVLNQLHGSYSDNESKIIPVKIHVAKQPFDPINKILIQPKLYADKKGEGAFWKDFNWQTASEVGMKEVGLPFSGKISFMETEMYWPVNHMVASKENTLQCNSCHTRENSRLAKLTDFYMPGRDYSSLVDTGGKWLIILLIIGILLHAIIRIFSYGKIKKESVK